MDEGVGVLKKSIKVVVLVVAIATALKWTWNVFRIVDGTIIIENTIS